MRNRGGLQTLKRDYQLWIMILPAIAVIFIFNYIPMYGIQLAFRDYDFSKGLTGGEWRGLHYFKQFIDSYLFVDLMRNTFLISLATIVIGFPAPIILALTLNQIRRKRMKNVMQTVVYLPHFISIIVLVGMMNVLLSPETGVVGHMMKAMGLGHINLIASTNTFIPVYVLSDIWQHCGWNSIIYLAALSTVDPQLYDSAKMDGASRWQMIRYVDLLGAGPDDRHLVHSQHGQHFGHRVREDVFDAKFAQPARFRSDFHLRVQNRDHFEPVQLRFGHRPV